MKILSLLFIVFALFKVTISISGYASMSSNGDLPSPNGAQTLSCAYRLLPTRALIYYVSMNTVNYQNSNIIYNSSFMFKLCCK